MTKFFHMLAIIVTLFSLVSLHYLCNLLQTKKQFKRAPKEYIHSNSFYSLNEFYIYNRL